VKPLLAALFLGLWCAACAVSGPALTIMSYNVENLFDDVHDGTEYREFDPGRGRWSTESFLGRVGKLSEVIRKSVPGGPDILLLQEVENGNALRTFVETGARGMGYSWRVLVPKKGLAANVAIVSRLPIARVRTHAVGPWKGPAPVRDILEAQIETGGHLLYVFNNHWKSRTEGVRATEVSRRESAAVLARRIAEILAVDPGADIVAAGDMNESVDEYARGGRRAATALMPAEEGGLPVPQGPGARGVAGAAGGPVIYLSPVAPAAGGPSGAGARCVLFDPWFEVATELRGSSAWQGRWITPDHVLLSAGLFDREGFRYRPGSFSAVRLPFLLDDRGFPLRWVPRGSREGTGFSDHLPIVLTLDLD
jgi:endonuclease/exonuclease/phosphatase family metal-dependent hydrolase